MANEKRLVTIPCSYQTRSKSSQGKKWVTKGIAMVNLVASEKGYLFISVFSSAKTFRTFSFRIPIPADCLKILLRIREDIAHIAPQSKQRAKMDISDENIERVKQLRKRKNNKNGKHSVK